MAWRINAERSSPPFNTMSMRAPVPAGSRALIISTLGSAGIGGVVNFIIENDLATRLACVKQVGYVTDTLGMVPRAKWSWLHG